MTLDKLNADTAPASWSNSEIDTFRPRPDLDWPVLRNGDLSRLVSVLGNKRVIEQIGVEPSTETTNHLNNLYLLAKIIVKTTLLEYGYRSNNAYGSKYDQSFLIIANHLPSLIARKKYTIQDLHEVNEDLNQLMTFFEFPPALNKMLETGTSTSRDQSITMTERVIMLIHQVSPDNNPPKDYPSYKQVIEEQLSRIYQNIQSTIANKAEKGLTFTPPSEENSTSYAQYMQALRNAWAAKRRAPESKLKRRDETIEREIKRRKSLKHVDEIRRKRSLAENSYLENKHTLENKRKKELQRRSKFIKRKYQETNNVSDCAAKLSLIGEISLIVDALSVTSKPRELERVAQTFFNYTSTILENSEIIQYRNLSKSDSIQKIHELLRSLWKNRSTGVVPILLDLANAGFIELELKHPYSKSASQLEAEIAQHIIEHDQVYNQNPQHLSSIEATAINLLQLKNRTTSPPLTTTPTPSSI